MNACVKTGLMFRTAEDNVIRTGDLFYIAGLWQIRGIPKAGFEMMEDRFIDVTVVNCVFAQRANSTYMDSNLGINLIAPSKGFLEHVAEWYPYLMDVLSIKAANDGTVSTTYGD
jgi:hypothetical protein